jgi:hypothetical protein
MPYLPKICLANTCQDCIANIATRLRCKLKLAPPCHLRWASICSLLLKHAAGLGTSMDLGAHMARANFQKVLSCPVIGGVYVPKEL